MSCSLFACIDEYFKVAALFFNVSSFNVSSMLLAILINTIVSRRDLLRFHTMLIDISF